MNLKISYLCKFKVYLLSVILVLDCTSSQNREMKLIDQDESFAIFELSNKEALSFQESISSSTISETILESKSEWNPISIEALLKSTLVVQASLFISNPSKIFSKDETYKYLSLAISQRLQNTQGSYPPTTYFVVVKENDDLAPFTKILRTSFYIFLNQGRVHIYFGEIRESISFLTPYTFSDWVSSQKFTVTKKGKSRITFLENTLLEAELLTSKEEEHKEYYLDAVAWRFKKDNPSNLSENKIGIEKKNESSNLPKDTESRLRLLKDLKKKGLITLEEYNKKRKSILDEI
ncbi:MAG: hypothetical protein CK427_01195 [Leptospira sp.]|nr:MAG: hypothetical protein CK427_01195 [Leptospira sp.]